jgi:hypothetical protein
VSGVGSVQLVLAAMAGSSVFGVIAAEVIRKFRSKEDKDALAAVASRDHAQGEAAVIAAMAGAFTDTTSSLREEIDRMQEMLNDFRERVALAEAENRASAVREAGLQRDNESLRSQLETAQGDVLRLRSERDIAVERVVQQEGEIRQRDAIIDATRRAESKT